MHIIVSILEKMSKEKKFIKLTNVEGGYFYINFFNIEYIFNYPMHSGYLINSDLPPEAFDPPIPHPNCKGLIVMKNKEALFFTLERPEIIYKRIDSLRNSNNKKINRFELMDLEKD